MPDKKSKSNRQLFMVIALGLGLAGLLYYFKSQFVVAWVNGRPITRSAYVQELEKIAKSQALDSLLTKQLIRQEAAKNKVTVADDEINQTITSIDEKAKIQGSSLEQLLLAQSISLDQVKEEIRLQKLLEKLVGPVTVADDIITSYWQDNQKALYPAKKFEEVKTEITDQLTQQELINKIQELIGRLQSEAKIVNWQ